jgi:hypothetical protein
MFKTALRGLAMMITLTMGVSVGAVLMDVDGVYALPDEGLGKKVFAKPNSVWVVYWEDLPEQGDADFNDLAVAISFGSLVGHDVVGTVMWLGGLSAHTNQLALPDGQLLTQASYWASFVHKKNVEVKLRFDDLTSGDSWWSGPAGYNSDHYAHAIVRQFDAGSGVPEPGTYALMGAGLIGLAGVRRFRRTS